MQSNQLWNRLVQRHGRRAANKIIARRFQSLLNRSVEEVLGQLYSDYGL